MLKALNVPSHMRSSSNTNCDDQMAVRFPGQVQFLQNLLMRKDFEWQRISGGHLGLMDP